MHDLPAYRVTTRQRVSWFTPETLAGLVVPLVITPIAFLAPVGALVGGLAGRARIERENREGKIIPPPTYFNKNILLGVAIGIVAMSGVGLLAGVGGFLTALVIGAETSSFTAGAFLVASSLAVAASGVMGAVQGRTRMEAEYHYARLSGTPLDGHEQEAKPNPDTMLDYFDGMNTPQKKFVAEEIARRQKRETEADGPNSPGV